MAAFSATPNSRRVKALEMLRSGKAVAETSTPGEFIVASQDGNGLYRVTGVGIPEGFEACTCEDFSERLARCKHIWAVVYWLEAARAPPSVKDPFPPTPPERRRPISWTVYNKAQTEEYRLLHVLLRELSASISEPVPNPKGGRPAVPLRDQAFSAIQKCYSGFGYRRSQGWRAEAAARGQLSRTSYWGVGSRFLCRPEMTPELHMLLAQSALPLIAVENACAIDSTGLRTTRFHYYRKEKYEPQRENVWLKMHALVGVETHAIPVLEVTEGSAGDSPMFPVLLQKAVDAGFRFEEVYADKAYNGRPNFEAAAELGMEPYIPFKSNATGHAKGSAIYHKMYLYFRYHRDEYDQHYGQRAQVESTFGAFKQKLGETVVSRTVASQVNEILCSAIAYNLTILIRQMFQRGLLPDFLQPRPKTRESPVPAPAVVSLAPALGFGAAEEPSVAKPTLAVAKPALSEVV
jgi:hypothetical protein